MASVTVIVPNYNHAAYLRKRLDSILNQKLVTIAQFIILDDCSSDDSESVINEYTALKTVTFVKNSKNSGSTFLQWKKGLSMATEEFVWIAESDDYADPYFLSTLINALKLQPTAGIAFCRSLLVGSNDELLPGSAVLPSERDPVWDTSFFMKGEMFIQKWLSRANVIPNVSSVVLRSACFNQVHDQYVQFRLSGDWLFYISLLIKSDVCYLHEKLNYFRVHEKSVRNNTHRSLLALQEHLRIIHYLFSHLIMPFSAKWKTIKSFMARFGFYSPSLTKYNLLKIYGEALRISSLFGVFVPYWLVFYIKTASATSRKNTNV